MASAVEEDVESLRQSPADPFSPRVVLQPLVGFPREFQAEDGARNVYTLSARDRLQSFEFTDNDKKRDIARLTFIDDEGVFVDPSQLAIGAAIDVAWGFPGKMSLPKRLIVKKLKLGMVQGRKWGKRRRGFLVTVEAVDQAFEHHTKAPTDDELFEDLPLSTVVRLVAERMGFHESLRGDKSLKIDVPPELDDRPKAYTRPSTATYPQFLRFLARHYDAVYRQNSSGLYFGFQDPTAAADYFVDMEGETLLGFELDGDMLLGAPGSLTVEAFNPSTQQIVRITKTARDTKKGRGKGSEISITEDDARSSQQGTESGDVEDSDADGANRLRGGGLFKTRATRAQQSSVLQNRVKEDFQPTTLAKANARATASFLERLKRTWKLRIRVVGDPQLAAFKTIDLRNFDTPLLDGVWYIREARHTVDPNSGYVTELQCNRQFGGKGLTGKVQLVNVRKTARTEADKEVDFKQSGQVESGALIGTSPTFGGKRAKKTHRTESGPYKDFDYHRRGG